MKPLSIGIPTAAALLCALLWAGCTFDSGLNDVTCEQDGTRDGDRVCRDGFWVPVDEADATDTATDSEPDTRPDAEPDAEPDAPSDAELDTEPDAEPDVGPDTNDTGSDALTCSGNETTECYPFDPQTEGVGLCSPGTRRCEGDTFGECQGATGPAAEICDGEDNNCDGQTDEGFPDKGTECTVGLGACTRTGVLECNATGDGLTCSATAGEPSDEICNNQIDEDCDGSLDNGCPQTETNCADGDDNDQDGLTDCDDEDCADAACGTGTGATCDFNLTECVENTCDDVDNDEDGDTDEGCDDDGDNYCDDAFTVTASATCSQSVAGDNSTYDCDDTNADIKPGATELCDGVDGDCDGVADESDADATTYCQSTGPGGSDCRLKQGSYCCDTSPAGGC